MVYVVATFYHIIQISFYHINLESCFCVQSKNLGIPIEILESMQQHIYKTKLHLKSHWNNLCVSSFCQASCKILVLKRPLFLEIRGVFQYHLFSLEKKTHAIQRHLNEEMIYSIKILLKSFH